MAWADGELAPQEVDRLTLALTRWGVPREEVHRHWLAPPEDPAELERVLPDHATRMAAVKLLLEMSRADGRMDFRELHYVRTIAARLGISQQELDTLF